MLMLMLLRLLPSDSLSGQDAMSVGSTCGSFSLMSGGSQRGSGDIQQSTPDALEDVFAHTDGHVVDSAVPFGYIATGLGSNVRAENKVRNSWGVEAARDREWCRYYVDQGCSPGRLLLVEQKHGSAPMGVNPAIWRSRVQD